VSHVCSPFADYCAETLPALADNIKKYVDDQNKEGIEMEGVADGFLTLQASAIRALVCWLSYIVRLSMTK
jgi:hypothetical protein